MSDFRNFLNKQLEDPEFKAEWGKSAVQSKDVTRSEIKVAKPVSWLSGKAAIVYIVPVP